MELLRFSLIRLASAIGLLALVATITFFATQGLPGDTARIILGQNASPEQVQALRDYLGLDTSIWHQYITWIQGIVHLDFGSSYVEQRPVSEVLLPKLLATVFVAGIGGLLGLVLAVLAAARCAIKPGGWTDRLALRFTVLITAVPDFVLGILLIIVFATGILHLLPATSLVDLDQPLVPQWRLLVLPSIALALLVMPHTFYMLRATLLKEMSSEYANYARLNGLSEPRILVSHALPNAIAPAAQVMALGLAYLVGGVVGIEAVFALPGAGSGLVAAVNARDLSVVQAITIFATLAYLVLTFVADLIGVVTTPRVRKTA